MHETDKNSKTFKDIEAYMHKTVPNAVINKVHILQNFELWRKFSIEKGILEKKLERQLQPEYLWHGTSKTDPVVIYGGYDGFHMRYANVGLWG